MGVASACHMTSINPSQVDRNLQDAMQVARNVMLDPRLVPGGGATEMALAQALNERAKSVSGVQQWPYKAVSRALEVIPRTLLQNCGANTIRVLTTLRVSGSPLCGGGWSSPLWCWHNNTILCRLSMLQVWRGVRGGVWMVTLESWQT